MIVDGQHPGEVMDDDPLLRRLGEQPVLLVGRMSAAIAYSNAPFSRRPF